MAGKTLAAVAVASAAVPLRRDLAPSPVRPCHRPVPPHPGSRSRPASPPGRPSPPEDRTPLASSRVGRRDALLELSKRANVGAGGGGHLMHARGDRNRRASLRGDLAV